MNMMMFGKEKGNNGYVSDSLDSLSSDSPTVITMAIDRSGSMGSYTGTMRETLSDFKATTCELTEVNSIRVGMSQFNAGVEKLNFCHPQNMNVSNYQTGGGTALYDAIGFSCEALKELTDELYNKGLAPKGLLFILSDGEENESRRYDYDDCQKLVNQINELGFHTVFVAFGGAFTDRAERMGFEIVCSADRSVSNLKKILSAATKSVQSISQSAGAKADDIQNFFDDITG